jgi:hypothetical protein
MTDETSARPSKTVSSERVWEIVRAIYAFGEWRETKEGFQFWSDVASDLQMLAAQIHTSDETFVQSQAASDVLSERRRQVTAEGWTPEHDDKHSNFELTLAAVCYALCAARPQVEWLWGNGGTPQWWPWAKGWWKPRGARRELVRAGALIVAEIERMDRRSLKANEIRGSDPHDGKTLCPPESRCSECWPENANEHVHDFVYADLKHESCYCGAVRVRKNGNVR